jgi:hypothetical protein
MTDTNENKPVVDTKPAVEKRIPAFLKKNSMFNEFITRFLKTYDDISAYNKEVLAEKTDGWTASKVLEESKKLSENEDATKIVASVKEARDAFESVAAELAKARRNLIEVTSKELGITLSAVGGERNSEIEEPLKLARKEALEIGKQMNLFAGMTQDAAIKEEVTKFFATYDLPAVGRNQTTTFGSESSTTTPKYRVNVTITNAEGEVLMEKSGFTAASLNNTSFYERGKALKSDKMRAAWEAAGNTPDNTVTSPVVFTDEGAADVGTLTYTITKK